MPERAPGHQAGGRGRTTCRGRPGGSPARGCSTGSTSPLGARWGSKALMESKGGGSGKRPRTAELATAPESGPAGGAVALSPVLFGSGTDPINHHAASTCMGNAGGLSCSFPFNSFAKTMSCDALHAAMCVCMLLPVHAITVPSTLVTQTVMPQVFTKRVHAAVRHMPHAAGARTL